MSLSRLKFVGKTTQLLFKQFDLMKQTKKFVIVLSYCVTALFLRAITFKCFDLDFVEI